MRIVGRHPAKTLPVGKIAVCGQGCVIAGDGGGVAFVHRGDSLFLSGKIKFQRVLIVAGFTVGIQNAGGIVTAIGVLGKLVYLAQQRYTVHFEPGTSQLDGRGGLPGGRHQFLQAEPGFQHFVLRLVFSADNVSRFICISKGLIVVDFITEIAFRKGQIVTVIGFTAVQGTALGNSGILIAVDIVGVLCAVVGKGGIAAGRLQLFVEKRILAGEVILPIGIHGDCDAGSTLHKVVSAQVEVCKCQLAVLDGGGGNEMVFFQHREIIGLPCAVGKHSGVPDGRAAGICDFGVIDDAGNAVRVMNVLRGV